jgi:transcriptional regulator with XRE-family HTH domain
MAQTTKALINPAMLEWARETAGYDIQRAAKKAQVKPDKYAAWEVGQSMPTVGQLRKLSNAFKRPLAIFYLSQVPKAFQPIKDFRRLPAEPQGRDLCLVKWCTFCVLPRLR